MCTGRLILSQLGYFFKAEKSKRGHRTRKKHASEDAEEVAKREKKLQVKIKKPQGR